MKPLVVYVDDEPMNHIAFESSLPEGWELVTITDAETAIERIATLEPWIVVCDQRMPVKSGNEILEVVKTLKPHAIRIITTGYSSEQLVIDSVRKAEVHDYMVKPWGQEFR